MRPAHLEEPARSRELRADGDVRGRDIFLYLDPLERLLGRGLVGALGSLLGDDLDGVAGPGLDVDPAIDVVDFDAPSWLKLVGLAPFGGFAVLELGLDDIAALRNAEADDEQRKREDCRS